MSVEIRPLETEDHQAVCDLIADETELFMVYPKGKFPLTTSQFENMLERRVDPTVLLVDEQVAGFAAFYGLRKKRYAYIGNVVIARDSRGIGLGRKLVSYMILLAYKKYKLPEVRISVYGQNTAALLLYSSIGFIPYAIQAKKDFRGKAVALISLSLRREK